MSLRAFLSKNIIIVVMVPVIFAGHYTWYRLQKVDSLVSEEERRKLPFASLMFGPWPPISLSSRDYFLKTPSKESVFKLFR